ncbi:hypothetical protein [Nocardioides marmoribigeumensis]|jgi:hypothetical protein|uniref:Secreted protein n=1 Tax=Nocardioides marmoribigeumensis TaxID=433649 RepID=A0ABU2BV82_9ACTN|nr:hypothetical protein [Nocardioides marmoribigeumensis]MDR7362537.1 hypothetical protein [Nocardioides marmoribigeumensis]
MRLEQRIAVVGIAVAAAASMATVPAYAENPAGLGQSSDTYQCDGIGDVVIRTPGTRADGGWSAGKIVSGGSGTLVPTSFTFSAYDDTTGSYLFPPETMVKGNGSTGPSGDLWTCHQSGTGLLSDLGDPGEPLPPGVSPTDTVTLTFTVTAVHEG